MNLNLKKINITIIGMGYVGLPLAINFGKKINTFGFDNSRSRINFLNKKIDNNNEFKKKDFILSKKVVFTKDPSVISNSDYIIVTVPTPINSNNQPDFAALLDACKNVGKYLKKKSTVIFEYTVYPGATRDICVPAIEKYSKKKWKKDFFIGYSPERANVGDKTKSVTKVKKIIYNRTFPKIKWSVCEDLIFSYYLSKKYKLLVCSSAKVQVLKKTVNNLDIKNEYYMGKLYSQNLKYFINLNKDLSLSLYAISSVGLSFFGILRGLFFFNWILVSRNFGRLVGVFSKSLFDY
jgi:UDP-N-acetyl-D-galactosamine dehydrogenase